MSDYGDTLRTERRLELAQRVLPAEALVEFYNHNHGKGGKFAPSAGGGGGGVGGNARLPKTVGTPAGRKAVAKGVWKPSSIKQQRAVLKAHKALRKEGGTYANVTSRFGLIKLSKLNSANLKDLSNKQLTGLHTLAKQNLQGAAAMSRFPNLNGAVRAYGRFRFNRLTPQIKRLESELSGRKLSFDVWDMEAFVLEYFGPDVTTTDFSNDAFNVEFAESTPTPEDILLIKTIAADIADDPDASPEVVSGLQDAASQFSLDDLYTITACGQHEALELSVKVDDYSATPSPEIFAAVVGLINTIKIAYAGYDVKCDIDVDVDDKSTEPADSYTLELDLDLDGISQTPSEAVKAAFDVITVAIKTAYGDKFDLEVDIDVDSVDIEPDEAPGPSVAAPGPSY